MKLINLDIGNRKRINITIIWFVIFSLVFNFILVQPPSHGIIKTDFSDGSSELLVVFPPGGGINDTINISIKNNTKINQASFKITSLPNMGQYPSNVFLDIGLDGDYDWAFNGKGYGAMGYQTFFKSSDPYLVKTFTGSGGETLSGKIRLPKDAEINSAILNIQGQITELATKTSINSNLAYIYNSKLSDIDGDNDLDAIANYYGGSPVSYKVSWFENTLGDGSSWTKHDITTSGLTSWTYGLGPGDLDGDGDMDVVISDSAWNSKTIYWYNNTNGVGTTWTRHTVESGISTTNGEYIYDLFIADMNNDNNLDIAVQLFNSNANAADVFWYNNSKGDGSTWDKYIIEKTIPGTRRIYVFDIDSDGDNDTAVVANQASGTDYVYWFSNDDGKGEAWSTYSIDSTIVDPFSLSIGDLDNDNNPDIVVIAQANTVWYEAPDDPTSGTWIRRTIGIGGGSGSWVGGDVSLADMGYNYTGKKPDNYLDVILVSRGNSDVVIYKNDGTPTNGGWSATYLDYNNIYVNDVDVGDVDGDSYSDTLTSSYYTDTGTSDDLVWYKIAGGYPTGVELKLGSDAQADWVEPNALDTTVQIPDFTFNLTQYINQETPYQDEYGNEFVNVEIEVTSDTAGRVILNNLKIGYDYTATVDQNPHGDLASELTEVLSKITPDLNGNCSAPFRFISSTAGILKVHDLEIEYNQFPWFTQDLPEILKLPEDTRNPAILDFSAYVDDDYLEPSKLGFNISYISGSGADRVTLDIADNHYLSVDSKTGSLNDNWTGQLKFKINVTDNFGSTIESDLITLKITPINDEPVLGSVKYPKLLFAEGQLSNSIDLDSRDYFFDPDGDPLYYSIVIDPEDLSKGENISYQIDPITNKLTFKALGDWFGSEIPVAVYCDDSQPVNYTLKQTLLISILNINDAPNWKEIPDITLKEDDAAYNYLDLKKYVYDIDDSMENLTISCIYNSNPDYITVSIDENKFLDIIPNIPEYIGSTDVMLRVTDKGLNFSDITFKITYESVNDPPTVKLLTPIDNSIVASDQVYISWDSYDMDNTQDDLTFVVYLSTSSPPDEKVRGISGNEFIGTGLKDETVYYCQLTVSDGESTGQSEIISFLVDATKQPKVKLVYPKANIVLMETSIEFEWTIFANEDNLDLTFDLYLDTDPNPILEGLVADGIVNTRYIIKGLEPNLTYYWTVIPRFESGLGICADGIHKFSIDISGIPYGLEIYSSITEIEIEHTKEEIIDVDIKNIGKNEERVIIVIEPRNISNNIEDNNPKDIISLGAGEDKVIQFYIDTTNIVPGEYPISIEIFSLDTPASAKLDLLLKVVEQKEKNEKEKGLFEDYMTLLPILIIIIIGVIGVAAIVRYKPQEEETFEKALAKRLGKDVVSQKTEIIYKPPFESFEPLGGEYQPQAQGVAQMPAIGPGVGPTEMEGLPQLPRGLYPEVGAEGTGETMFDEMEQYPPVPTDQDFGLEQPIEPPFEEGPKVLLPEEIEELKKLEESELDITHPEVDTDTIPEIELPEPITEAEPTRTPKTELKADEKSYTGPQFGETLKLEVIEPESTSSIIDKDREIKKYDSIRKTKKGRKHKPFNKFDN